MAKLNFTNNKKQKTETIFGFYFMFRSQLRIYIVEILRKGDFEKNSDSTFSKFQHQSWSHRVKRKKGTLRLSKYFEV